MELLDQLHTALGGGYRIDRELGAAGMSRVFVATDGKLGRQVVVKVLPPHLAAEVSIERFRREILLAASLVHPHIVTLLSAGDFDGVPYYTMPFVEGQSLRARLERDLKLDVPEAIELAREVLGALDFAHRRNIVHRDIKPGNILINEGHAVVTDFGIARAITESRSTNSLTQGAGIGTPEYMSPEQWTGEAADGRTDIYAMGCVLFEMLCGSPPFPAKDPKPLLTRVLMDAPPLVTMGRADAPPFLDSVVQRALAKEAGDRFPTAAEFAAALGQRLAVAVARRELSVVVLPFANISGDPSNDYLSDGITDELISSLTRAGGVRVVPRTSAFEYKGQSRDIRQFASLLGVTHVLEGSIRIAGRRIRATAQLVDADSGHPLWSERYDRELEDVFAVQDEVTAAIIERLLGEIGPDTHFDSARTAERSSVTAPAARPSVPPQGPCRNCGAPNDSGATFCSNCGANTGQAAAFNALPPAQKASAPMHDELQIKVKEHLGLDFTVEKEIGRGGLGVVYRAIEITSKRPVALKVLAQEVDKGGRVADRFRREGRLSASLDHPNILPIYRVGTLGPLHFMAMKLVEGRPVDAIVEAQGALPLGVVLAILTAAARGLAFAHDKRIVHRDIKGANILVDKDASVMVSDFGIASAVEEMKLTASGMVVGTPTYMSPEQCGGQKISPQSDQYSLGILGFQLLTGEVPFHADSMVGVIQHHYLTPVPDIRAVRNDVPQELLDIIYCSLNKDPEDRFATTRDMLLALERVPQTAGAREEATGLLKELAAGQAIPKVRTGTLPPLTLTISGPAAPAHASRVGAPAKPELTADRSMVDALRGEFEFVRDIGRGALGVVYLARRVGTGEQVAIKTLLPELAVHDAAVARFARQAESAASLRHPNLLRVFEVRQTPEFTCLISEFIDGVSLDDALESVRGLPLQLAMAILAGAGAGLNHGHERGLIHTAFTPTNILLAKDGRVIVTDFGIGNIQQPDNLTASGVTMGAPFFMSPEQLSAGHLTPATDQYALGIIAYRLLVGTVPFGDDKVFRVIQRQMTEPVPRGLERRSDVSPALARAIYRMLEKEGGKRYPSIAAALADGGVTVDPEVASSMIAGFLRPPTATTARMTASFASPVIRGAARRMTKSNTGLHVALGGLTLATLAGAMVIAGVNGPRIAAIATAAGLFLWIGVRQLAPLLMRPANQRDAVSGEQTPAPPTRKTPTRSERRRMAEQAISMEAGASMLLQQPAGTVMPKAKPEGRFPAYDAYLRGRYLINRSAQDWLARGRGRSRWPAAIAQFDEALRLDPSMTPAYAARAYTRTLMGRFGAEPASALRDLALADVESAIARNPRFAEAHLVRGIIATLFDWSATDAREAFARATALNANYAEAHLWRGMAASWLERGANAATLMQRALALDPLSSMGKIELARALYGQRDYGAALTAVDDALVEKPANAFGQYTRACILTSLDRLDEALEAINEAVRIGGRQVDHLAQLAVICARRGATDDVTAAIRELESRGSAATAVAVAYAAIGDTAAAVSHVGRAIEEREPMLLAALAGPNFDALRQRPEFIELLRQASLAGTETPA